MTETKPDTRRPTLYLIDGHAQIFRAYHAIRSLRSTVTNEPTNATFGFVGMLLKLWRQCKPDYVAVAIDASGDRGTFRSQIYPEYKANRSAPPEDLHPQVQRIVELCHHWQIPVLGIEEVEADDTIATLCTQLTQQHPDLDIRIVSRDKDLEQLLAPHIALYDIHKDETVDVAKLAAEKKLTPDQVIDALALMGDAVDNVPGIPGVGPKTAAKLIAQFGSIDNLLKNTDQLSGKLKQNIEAHADQIPLSKNLVTLRHDVPLTFDLESASTANKPQLEPLAAAFKQLGFTRHLEELHAITNTQPEPATTKPRTSNRRPKPVDDTPPPLFASLETEQPAPTLEHATNENYTAVTTAEQLNELIATLNQLITDQQPLSIDTETDRLDPMQAKLCGVCLAWKPEHGVYIPVRSSQSDTHLDQATVLNALRPILEHPELRIVGQNIKYDLLILRNAGITLPALPTHGFDTMVASYLVDATRASHKLDNLALNFLNHEMIPITDLIGKGKNQRSMIELPVATVTPYAAEDADITLRLYHHFAPQLKIMGLLDLFHNLEIPLVQVLAELEYNGILVQPDVLDQQKKTIDKRIEQLHDEIIQTAGQTFNPDSPKQLADILFNKLGCNPVKKLKTGPSTDSEVLAKIADEQPPPGSVLAALILEYRQLTKLRGTYLESLKAAINPDTKRIHASFNQTVTATGRLSSSDPNLQNIPIRTELGRQIRKAFIAPPNHLLLSADYSQIELRLLAHLSQDPNLITAFEQDLDIHAAVAAEVFETPLDQVTPEQRGTAKMVNFGIVYGITPYGLARRLPNSAAGSSVEVATQIINDYKQRYPKINDFLNQCIHTAENRGYVETIAKRRRPINIPPRKRPRKESDPLSFAERTAINTVVQGSAADLIKIAMVNLHKQIREQQRPLKMLLQIHDELVFELPEHEAEEQSSFIQQTMTTALPLTVPLKVDLHTATNWFAAK